MADDIEDTDDSFDDSNYRDAEEHEKPPTHPQELMEKLLDKFDSLTDPVQTDWYNALLLTAVDHYHGDMEKAMTEADSSLAAYPYPPLSI